MKTQEFSNEFDVLYNNIMSNAAPGLNEYEKSVFLTKAQEEIIYNYFNPKGNKYGEGFDDSIKRQIDFSELIKSDYGECNGYIGNTTTGKIYFTYKGPKYHYMIKQETVESNSVVSVDAGNIVFFMVWTDPIEVVQSALNVALTEHGFNGTITLTSLIAPIIDSSVHHGDFTDMLGPEAPNLVDSGYDIRGVIYRLPKDLLFIVNESVEVGTNVRQVVPIRFDEYSRLMSKPYKEPLKYQIWRLISDNDSNIKVELIPHSGDNLSKYKIRYVRRPKPIILTNLNSVYDGLTINGEDEVTECELNPIVHRAILDRAVELAKAAYIGDLKSTVELNTRNE